MVEKWKRALSIEIGSEKDDITFDGKKLPNSYEEKRLDIITDNELKFDPLGVCVKKRKNYER